MGAGGVMKPEPTKKNSRTQLIVLAGVSVVGAAVVIRMVAGGPQSAPAASVTTPGVTAALTAPGTSANVPAETITVAWPATVARDPFSSDLVFPPPAPPPPPTTPKVDVPVVVAPPPPTPKVDVAALAHERIHLKATVLGERPLAMTNGRVYRVGEVVEGFKIVEIEKNQMTVERDGTRVVIKAN